MGGVFADFRAQEHTGSLLVDMAILSADGTVRR